MLDRMACITSMIIFLTDALQDTIQLKYVMTWQQRALFCIVLDVNNLSDDMGQTHDMSHNMSHDMSHDMRHRLLHHFGYIKISLWDSVLLLVASIFVFPVLDFFHR
jgi:hypothetical protein